MGQELYALKEVANISNQHVDHNKVTDIIVESTLVKIDALCISNILIDLYNRYYFNESLSLIIKNTSTKYRCVNDVPINSELKYIMCIDMHNKILIIDEKTFEAHIESSFRSTINIIETDVFTDELRDVLDNKAITSPAIYYINGKSDTKQFIELYHDNIYINIHDKRYVIAREIFDMLYVESEDFIPTTDLTSGITIKTQARHQIYNDGYYSTDLLRSDIGLLCDIQDKLITEYTKISQEHEE